MSRKKMPFSLLAMLCLRTASLGSLLAVLVGCSSPVGFSSSTLAPEQSVLAYYQWLTTASAEALATELRLLPIVANRNSQAEIKRALVLSVPASSSVKDEAEAMLLLQEVAAEQPSLSVEEDYRLFALHWLDMLQMRRRLREFGDARNMSDASLEALRQSFDDLTERYQGLSALMNSMEQQNGLLERQNALMQQQIEALTAIEQQLVEQRGATATP